MPSLAERVPDVPELPQRLGLPTPVSDVPVDAHAPLVELDGGAAVPGLVARMLRGTGHINAGLGAVMTVQGVGASLSPAIAGLIVARYGFSVAYLVLAGFAVCGVALWLISSPKIASACSGD